MIAVETMHERHPDYKKGGLRMELANFGSLFITRQMFRRTAVACLMQVSRSNVSRLGGH